MSIVLSGRIVSSSTGAGVQNAMIGVHLADSDISRPLAESRAGRGGAFTIPLDKALAKVLEERQASVLFRAKLNESLLVLDPLVEWKVGDNAQGIELVAVIERDQRAPEATRTVFGRVMLGPSNHPVEGVSVRASDRDLRDQSVLGTATTGARGEYEIVYDRTDFAKTEKGTADIAIEVLAEDGETVLFATPIEDIHFNAPADLRWDIVLEAPPIGRDSELERVARTVDPLLGDLDPSELQETVDVPDITFLTAETQLPQEQIESFALAARLARKTDQSLAVFYALLRRGASRERGNRLFNVDHRVVLESDLDDLLESLSALGAEKTKAHIEAAEEERLVPRGTTDALNALLELLEKYGGETRATQGSKSSDKVLLSAFKPLLDGKRLDELLHLVSGEKSDFSAFLEDVAKSEWLGETDVTVDNTSGEG